MGSITGHGNLVITGTNAEAISDRLGSIGSPPPQPGISTDQAQSMNSNKRQRLEKQAQTLESEWNTRTDKLGRLRADLAIEVSAAIKFQLEKQIQAEEAEIALLDKQLSEIEDTLNAGGQSPPEKK